MSHINNMVVGGTVGRDAETRYTLNGLGLIKFSIAHNQWNRQEGKEKTTWFTVTAFGDRFLKIADQITKGKSVTISGKFEARPYTNNEGKDRVDLGITAQEIVFNGGGGKKTESDDAPW